MSTRRALFVVTRKGEGPGPRYFRFAGARRVVALASAGFFLATLGAAAGDTLSRPIGKALFERAWVPAPSSTKANDGLGPLFNARACAYCHQGLDRAISQRDPDGTFTQSGMVLKLSDAAGRLDPAYGGQLQTSAVPGLLPEGRLVMAGATPEIQNLVSGPLAPSTRMGVRAAPSVRGLGLLAGIPDEAILARADPDDRDGDGVSGRPNRIVDANGTKHLGRFGLKSSSATIAAQTELAFSLDIGMSTSGHPDLAGDCLSAACRAAPHGGTLVAPEIRPDLVAMLADYLAGVPPLQPASPPDPDGVRLFAAVGCASCHTPSLPGAKGEVHAFSDLLLHDLGPDLDGGATEPNVAPTEWRTAPLWGVSRALATHAGLLHDGRAPGVTDAVALHGGEGAQARTRFGELAGSDRDRLIRYVEGL
jgi:CxxC motif-containing protein (DUF1111 family)